MTPGFLLPLALTLVQQPAAAAGGAPHTDLSDRPLAQGYLDAASRILGRALIANRGMETLEVLCDEIGPRLSGSANGAKAVEFCLQRMREHGLQNVRAEEVMVPHWVRGHCDVQLRAPATDPLIACALGGSVGTPDGPVQAPVVAVASFEDLRALDPDDVKGKVVLFNQRMQRMEGSLSDYGRVVPLRTGGAVAAARLGAEFAHFEGRFDTLATDYAAADLDEIDRAGALRLAAERLMAEAGDDALSAEDRDIAAAALNRLYAYAREDGA